MNKEQAKAWLPLIQAMAEGKTLQSQHIHRWMGNQSITWNDIRFLPESLAAYDVAMFRIKPEPKKQSYRVGLFKDDEGIFFTYSIDKIMNFDVYETYETKPTFVRWLTDRIEYELPEGDA